MATQSARSATTHLVWGMTMVASVCCSPRSSTPTGSASLASAASPAAAADPGASGPGGPEDAIRSVLELRQMELQIEVNKRLAAQQAMFAQAELVDEACGVDGEDPAGGRFADLLSQPTELSSLMREIEGARREEMAVERALLREREYNAALAARIATLEDRFGDADT